MERFKILVDVENSATAMEALLAATEAISRNPMQEVGYNGFIEVETASMVLILLRFSDQYTIREK